MGLLDGKIAIVTGSDSGIGKATAEAFAREGADVAVAYLHDRDGAEDTRRRVESCGRRAKMFHLDQRNPQAVARLFTAAEEQLGTPYILVNNAGVDSTGVQVADMSPEEWDERIRTDLYGPFYCSQHFIRARRKAGGKGKLINITSVHEDIPRVGSAGYDCAKGGLRMLTRTLCLELAPDHINVNSIAPGMVLTPMNQPAVDDPKVREEQVQSIPWKRAAEPSEVAELAVYLASEKADYITGQSFVIDGGLERNLGQGA
jgi:glucose 1-dehydrogenase